MTDSTTARPIVVEAIRRTLGREPTLAEVYTVQAVARYDGGYGNFTSPPHGPEGPSSNNWGAVQHPDLPKHRIWLGVTNANRASEEVKAIRAKVPPRSPFPSEWFYASDYLHPNRGGQGWFWGPYRVYSNASDGAAHVVRLLAKMKVLDVANRPGASWHDIAARMHAASYFVGYGDDAAAIRGYAENLAAGARVFEKLFKEVSPIMDPKAQGGVETVVVFSSSLSSLPVLRMGSQGEAVKLWQRVIGVVDDGKFGRTTQEVTKAWQKSRSLLADGVVGPKTWRLAP